jgi:hypothetical protein
MGPRLFKDGGRLGGRAFREKGEGMNAEKTARGKRGPKRGNARYAPKRLVPRLALWAGVGVFVCALALSCGDDEGSGSPGPAGFVYVVNYETVLPGIQKFSTETGKRVNAYTPNGLCISAAVDPDNGDLFSYSWSSLYRYDKDGKLIYRVWADTARRLGREYIAFNGEAGRVYFLNGSGKVHYFRAADGEWLGAFYTRLEDHEGIVVDDVENTEWVMAKGGAVVRKYSFDGDNLLVELSDGPYTEMAVDDSSNTMLFGVIKGGRGYVVRYSKAGAKKQEILAGLAPTALAVEPGSGRIWVSDGDAIERYKGDGTKIEGLASLGFLYMDFTDDAAVAFAVSRGGLFYAIDTRSLKILWRGEQYPSNHDIHFVGYSKY